MKIVGVGRPEPGADPVLQDAGAPVDSYAVGSYISGATPIDFTGDIKEIDGQPIAKRGRIPGLTGLAAAAAGGPRPVAGRRRRLSRCTAVDSTGRATIRPWIEPDLDDDRESAYELLQRGQELIATRHHAQAAIVLERALRLEPGKGSILEALGQAYYNSGQYERSRETFEALLEVDPSSHYAPLRAGPEPQAARAGRSEARTHLRLAVALSPRSELYAGALARLR